ncbi:Axonemal dynein light intermediate polypeptide 1, partial [Fragariocoptes setiger]
PPESPNTTCRVSTKPALRRDVAALRLKLDDALSRHRARPVGLCSVRRAIYDQFFDELIRQVTVNCTERGLMLYQVRNELRMTLDAYRSMYESGIAFNLRKAISVEHEVQGLRCQIQELTNENETIKRQLNESKRLTKLEHDNQLEKEKLIKQLHADQLAARDTIIEQQR